MSCDVSFGPVETVKIVDPVWSPVEHHIETDEYFKHISIAEKMKPDLQWMHKGMSSWG